MAPVVEKLTLTNPKIRLERQEDNRYNIDDFVAFAMEPKEDDSSAKFAVNNIQIKNGLVEFDDKPKNKRHFVDELNLTIPFHFFPAVTGQYLRRSGPVRRRSIMKKSRYPAKQGRFQGNGMEPSISS